MPQIIQSIVITAPVALLIAAPIVGLCAWAVVEMKGRIATRDLIAHRNDAGLKAS